MDKFSEYFVSGQWRDSAAVREVARLMAPCDDVRLEEMARQARALTLRHFGKTMRLFAPLYLSNECVNICQYCGFSRTNPILRTTLTPEQVGSEAEYLAARGFRSVLLVAGEHPKFVSADYVVDCIARTRACVPSVSLEIGPAEEPDYRSFTEAGADGLIVYQETYCTEVYERLHTSGPKRDFHWRLDCPQRAANGGFKRVGIGALLGLTDWRQEVLALAAHADFLMRVCWKSFLTVSFPRLRPAAGGFQPEAPVSDRDFVQILCALRLVFPQIGLVLSTREPAALRDRLFQLGITHTSAGVRTDPGGYTQKDTLAVHKRVAGKAVPVIASEEGGAGEGATEQFAIADGRSAEEVSEALKLLGYDPVWKDWDAALAQANSPGI